MHDSKRDLDLLSFHSYIFSRSQDYHKEDLLFEQSNQKLLKRKFTIEFPVIGAKFPRNWFLPD